MIAEAIESVSKSLEGRPESLLFFFLIALVAVALGWHYQFFKPLKKSVVTSHLQLHHLLIAFALFLFITILIVPTMMLAAIAIVTGNSDVEALASNPLIQGWLNITAIIISAIAVVTYSRCIDPSAKREVWGEQTSIKESVKSYFTGIATWLIAFPVTNVVAQLVVIILLWIKPDANIDIDQTAVHFLKSTMPYPVLLTLTVICLVFLAPIIEELLFRGFFQSWLKSKMGRWPAIVVASLVFAGFHFSITQQFANVELLFSLFVLSMFLGYLFERQNSIWAPIGLHTVFNGISVGALLYQG
jgi:membrane protease YdiL (CAAX protease family)